MHLDPFKGSQIDDKELHEEYEKSIQLKTSNWFKSRFCQGVERECVCH